MRLASLRHDRYVVPLPAVSVSYGLFLAGTVPTGINDARGIWACGRDSRGLGPRYTVIAFEGDFGLWSNLLPGRWLEP